MIADRNSPGIYEHSTHRLCHPRWHTGPDTGNFLGRARWQSPQQRYSLPDTFGTNPAQRTNGVTGKPRHQLPTRRMAKLDHLFFESNPSAFSRGQINRLHRHLRGEADRVGRGRAASGGDSEFINATLWDNLARISVEIAVERFLLFFGRTPGTFVALPDQSKAPAMRARFAGQPRLLRHASQCTARIDVFRQCGLF